MAMSIASSSNRVLTKAGKLPLRAGRVQANSEPLGYVRTNQVIAIGRSARQPFRHCPCAVKPSNVLSTSVRQTSKLEFDDFLIRPCGLGYLALDCSTNRLAGCEMFPEHLENIVTEEFEVAFQGVAGVLAKSRSDGRCHLPPGIDGPIGCLPEPRRACR